jgi:hypothetical protein
MSERTKSLIAFFFMFATMCFFMYWQAKHDRGQACGCTEVRQ